MRVILLFGALLVVSLGLWNGCAGRRSPTEVGVLAPASARGTSLHIESGTQIRVVLRSRISAQATRPGEAWEGWMAEDAVVYRAATQRSGPGTRSRTGPTADAVVVLEKVVIPAGSHVTGVGTAAAGETSGPWAMPVLAVKAIDVEGRALAISASAGQVVAGFPRARGPGAHAGGADAIVLCFTVSEVVDLQ